MRWTIKSFGLRVLALLTVGTTLFLLFLMGFSPLSPVVSKENFLAKEIGRTYFVNSPTCFAREKSALQPIDLAYVQGEKVTYACEGESEQFVRALLQDLSAQVLWTEEVDGVFSYYASSKKMGRQVFVDGQIVNLHIAVQGDRVVVGVPIIFGGY